MTFVHHFSLSQVLKWVEEAIQASKVHLLSTDHESGGERQWKIPFDPSLKEVTISLSGPEPVIQVTDPTGKSCILLLHNLTIVLCVQLRLYLKINIPVKYYLKCIKSAVYCLCCTLFHIKDFAMVCLTYSVIKIN